MKDKNMSINSYSGQKNTALELLNIHLSFADQTILKGLAFSLEESDLILWVVSIASFLIFEASEI